MLSRAPTMGPVDLHQDVATAPPEPPRHRGAASGALPGAAGRGLATAFRFGTVGAAGALVNTVALHLFYAVADLPLAVASALATELAIGHNYLLNDRWTFRRRSPTWPRFLRFNVSALGGLVATVAVLWGLVHIGVGLLAGNVLAIGAGAAVNFAFSTLWVWPRKAA